MTTVGVTGWPEPRLRALQTKLLHAPAEHRLGLLQPGAFRVVSARFGAGSKSEDRSGGSVSKWIAAFVLLGLSSRIGSLKLVKDIGELSHAIRWLLSGSTLLFLAVPSGST